MLTWFIRLWHRRRDQHLATLRFAVNHLLAHAPKETLGGVWRDEMTCTRAEQVRRGLLRVWIKGAPREAADLASYVFSALREAKWGNIEIRTE